MPRKAFTIWLALFGFGHMRDVLAVQDPTIRVVRSTQISVDAPRSDFAEPWLAVNPTNPSHLIASGMIVAGGVGTAVYFSVDGGTTWQRGHDDERDPEVFNGGDPMITFDAAGAPYFTVIQSRFRVWTSTDSGRHWTSLDNVPGGGYDRQWLAVDRTTGEHRGRLYAAGKVRIKVFGSRAEDLMMVSRSLDGGLTWQPPRRLLPDPQRESLHVVSDLLVAPNGALVVPFVTYFWGAGEAGGAEGAAGAGRIVGRYSVIVSQDGGRTFSDPIEVARHSSFGHGRPQQSIKGLGGGRIAVDRSSGPLHGALYLVWVEAIGEYFQIVLASSKDGGTTWSEPVRVNDGGLTSNHSNPAIAVNEHGTVAVSWNDRRNDAQDNCFQLFMAVSTDGGRSLHPNERIGEGRTCPRHERWMNGGDTQGIVDLPGGRFQLAWINGAGGTMQLWTSTVEVER